MDKRSSALASENKAAAANGALEQDLGSRYEIPAPEPFISFSALKDRIRRHYEICSDYYYSLWYCTPPSHA
jgi:hypothetical protein